MSKWRNVPGTFSIKFEDCEDVPPCLVLGIEPVRFLDSVLEIHFLSSGEYVPARVGCDPDNGWASEYEDERELDHATLNGEELSKELAQKLFDHYQDRIDEVEIDTEADYD